MWQLRKRPVFILIPGIKIQSSLIGCEFVGVCVNNHPLVVFLNSVEFLPPNKSVISSVYGWNIPNQTWQVCKSFFYCVFFHNIISFQFSGTPLPAPVSRTATACDPGESYSGVAGLFRSQGRTVAAIRPEF
jgi:hypothetical protein